MKENIKCYFYIISILSLVITLPIINFAMTKDKDAFAAVKASSIHLDQFLCWNETSDLYAEGCVYTFSTN